MDSLLNDARPPVFCPGCSHERITQTLNKAFQNMGLAGNQVVIVSDIGCSGLFDTFFNTHAFHGLHGRALTYAAGLKLAQPDLTVIATMGDGGLGIGGAHLLAASRRNLDLTLLILNNFNFGMTGGQFSVTTPPEANIGSAFLNQLEYPLDICQIVRSAGAPYAARCSAYDKDLAGKIQAAIEFEGFAALDIWGICPGRYTKKNRLTPKLIEEAISALPPAEGTVSHNVRKEYAGHYRELAAARGKMPSAMKIRARFQPPRSLRQEVVLLGSAGQRVITAGEILCLAGLSAGLRTTQKNEYNITVLRGPSISELILSPEDIDYTGIERPVVVVALGQEGVDRRKEIFDRLADDALIIQSAGIRIPPSKARIYKIDFKSQGIKKPDWGLASLALLAGLDTVINFNMLEFALKTRFAGKAREDAMNLVKLVERGSGLSI
jgi:pyruvate/2-oxoacid:ferredoxin oxidoreductase beta subunit/Pyruvate/2-oxoacid:ferredoxin oxidoreductase gamma subunit